MAQTRLGSFAEAWTNIAVGFAINFTANMLILPLFGFDTLTASKAFGIGLIFTLISLARSYVLRRWFNGLKFGNTPEPQGYTPQKSRLFDIPARSVSDYLESVKGKVP